jgi:hypothetical protein
MPLQDQQDFQHWLARRRTRNLEVGIEEADSAVCGSCGVTGDEQQIVEGTCLVCLARDFGGYAAEHRIATVIQAIATATVTSGPVACHRLLQHVVDGLEDAINSLQAEDDS